MCESVSRFQAEVAAVMEVLVKVAVVEITKVFEGRSLHPHGCTVNREAPMSKDVPDIRAHMQNALANVSKMVCSVGVQVEETLLSQHHVECTSSEKDSVCPHGSKRLEGLCPSETHSSEAVDLQCMVDLPCSIFSDNGIGLGKGDGVISAPLWTGDLKKQEMIQENGHQGLAESSSCSVVDPEVDPFSSVVDNIPSEDRNTDTLGQLDLGLMEVGSLPSRETPLAEPSQSSQTTAEPTHSSQGSNNKSAIQARHASNLKKVRLQLSQTPFDCKLLKPCSVELVNLLMLSRAVKRTNASSGHFPSTHKDLRTHQNAHSGRRLCCFTECENGIWRLQGVLARGHPLACKICGKKFKRRKILRRHERFHTGEKPYSCIRCKKRFALRKSLRRHERFHTGERPHNCAQCGKGFRLKNNLKVHLRFHSNEKPYACNMCSKSFRIPKNLEKHRLTHSAPGRCRSVN
ncbi:zinc finger protein 23 [Triplophysa rosa]|uniref:C2H2-type domain-containing protein n=1 Tax=Triplophysa rosa TaxID=992332 RepID=A0A9W7WWB3_TRIRA|nr:zinc finger protein 23 [Triplophysa rosa]KAI7809434.1 hypothetical protein IRJ41_008081 [Triplophysa rosa]